MYLRRREEPLQIRQSRGVSLAGGEVSDKSFINRSRVWGLSAGSISRAGGGRGLGHGTVGGKGVTQPASKVTATGISRRQASLESTFNLLSACEFCPQGIACGLHGLGIGLCPLCPNGGLACLKPGVVRPVVGKPAAGH